MNHVRKKPDFSICETTKVQISRPSALAYQRLCCSQCTNKPVAVAEQSGLSLTRSETLKDMFTHV